MRHKKQKLPKGEKDGGSVTAHPCTMGKNYALKGKQTAKTTSNVHAGDSLEGVGAASRDLAARGALPDPRHLTLGGVLAAEGASVLRVLGDLLVRNTPTSIIRTPPTAAAKRDRGADNTWGSRVKPGKGISSP